VRPLKRITLLRHAKAESGEATTPDRERQLNERGRHDVPVMGKALRRLGVRPSLVLTSPAKRALETALLICRELDYPREFLQREHDLYLATAGEIIKVIARQDNSFNDILVCGHNPGLTDLANHLAGSGIDNVPTCGLVIIEAPIRDWQDLEHGRLIAFDTPKNHR
jgi:phosphohistidine phosphatase